MLVKSISRSSCTTEIRHRANEGHKYRDAVFLETKLGNAILDCVLHNATVVNIVGPSFKIKDHLEKEDVNKFLYINKRSKLYIVSLTFTQMKPIRSRSSSTKIPHQVNEEKRKQSTLIKKLISIPQ